MPHALLTETAGCSSVWCMHMGADTNCTVGGGLMTTARKAHKNFYTAD